MTDSWKAVLTGDIVASTKLIPERRKNLYEIFIELSKKLQQKYPLDIKYRISNFRGDGWQLIVEHPEKSLEISLYIRTFIRFTFKEEKLDSRIAIGIGSTNFIPDENISAGDGPAYTASGRLLESLSSDRMILGFAENGEQSIEKQGAQSLISLIDFIVTSWGASQAQAAFWAMQDYKQTEIAQKWIPRPIKQTSVSRSLKSAGWEHIKQGKDYFEKIVKSLEP